MAGQLAQGIVPDDDVGPEVPERFAHVRRDVPLRLVVDARTERHPYVVGVLAGPGRVRADRVGGRRLQRLTGVVGGGRLFAHIVAVAAVQEGARWRTATLCRVSPATG
ncbi:hypothetical protein [Streptomyces sp. NPDC088254]|uniref:hypothetical protein n=1 Tax=Streptomyces sp. NPDC088254 TaxID=3365847 RepID=UPI0037FA1E54